MHQSAQGEPRDSGPGSPGEVFAVFLKLGCTSFGGPIAHLGYFRTELVERRRWVSDSQFGQLLAICQFLPGPASSQLGFSLGLLRAGWAGAVAAFLAFTLPSALLLLAFASALPLLAGPSGQALVHGLKLVALAVVADAVLGMARKLCPDLPRATIAVATAAALLLAGSGWMQLLVVAAGALAGLVLCKGGAIDVPSSVRTGYGNRLGAVLLVLFMGLLVGLPLLPDQGGGLMALAEAFYRAGALVFGGGHVVLPLLEDAVVSPGWVGRETFLAGYGAAQAIPGPMFAFSAYLGAVVPTGHPAWAGAATALLCVFLPGFLLVAGVLPLWHRVSRSAAANKAIAGANAAVVGLLGAALYDPIFSSAVGGATDMAIGMVGFAMLQVWRFPAWVVVLWCASASLLRTLV
jgi:chromate transporter